MSTCSSCGAPITWATSEAGKPIPLSTKTLERRVVVRRGEDGKLSASVAETYLSHFVDCPNRDQHRRPRA